MIKKCLGCGIELQDNSPYTLGYTPNLENEYCERCFKITHYNANIDANLGLSNNELLEKINKKDAFVIFLCDFLNIYGEVINMYKKITCPKMLVITKSDIIPKNIIKSKIVNNIKNEYEIEEDIVLCSTKIKENLSSLTNIIKDKKKVLMAGFTNSGKSSLINHLIGAKITVSKNANTTLDFIKLTFDEYTIFDAPGFVPTSFIDSMTPKGYIKPISYQLKSKYCLKFLNIVFSSSIDNNITLYLNNAINVEKRNIVDKLNTEIEVSENSDLIIKGLGFINIKKKCQVRLNIDKDLIEIRPSIIGGKYE